MSKRRLPAILLAIVTAAGFLVGMSLGVPAGAASRAGLQPGSGQIHGLKGDYYVSSVPGAFDFGQFKGTALDANLDFGDLVPALSYMTGQSDNTTVRWTGQIQPRYSETYTFSVIGDNGFRLWVNGQLLIDHWVDDWNIEHTGTPIALQAGQKYDIKVEYFNHTGGANLHLSWQSPSQPKQIVPEDALYPPAGYQYPGPASATVSPDGKTATLTFAGNLQPLAAGIDGHLGVYVNYSRWPVTSMAVDSAGPAVITAHLSAPIPQKAGNAVRVIYDGNGGLATSDGASIPAFNRYADNNSTYQITTRWASQVSPGNALPDYPRPQLTRSAWQNLNGTWQYAGSSTAGSPPIGRNLSGRILVPYPPESQLSGVGKHSDYMFYRRMFTVPGGWQIGQNRLLLHFGAVDYQAWVYVNGKQVASHTGGYSAFDPDITSAVTGNGPQELVVAVRDQVETGPQNQPIGKQRVNPGGIWYTSSSGIWQTVWLEPVPAAYITGLDQTPDLASSSLQLTVHASGTTGQQVEAVAYAGGKPVGSVSGAPGSQLSLPVPNAHLWTPDDPFLYDLQVRLLDGSRPVDQVGSYFGMRSVSVGTVGGQPHMLLNGKFVFNLGTLDQGFWPDGLYTAPTDAALKSDLLVEKALGFNTVRKHVKVEPQRWYYWADKLGMLVWQDMPSMNPGAPVSAADQQEFTSELQTMIDQHRDHPSIIMWEPFNEGWGEFNPAQVASQVKSWDPSRLVDVDSGQNCCASLPDPHAGDVYDNHAYVGPGVVKPTDTRAVTDGEFGGLGLNVPGHTWFGSGFAYEMESSATQLTDRYVQLLGQVQQLEQGCGLSAAIYTQPSDVEGELNGLQTYDRQVLKVDPSRVRAANQAVLAAAQQTGSGSCPAG